MNDLILKSNTMAGRKARKKQQRQRKRDERRMGRNNSGYED